ncbi:succinate dehydrogenase assembly factor 2 [Aliiroseovarius sp. KMU-50]|uniref:FAD assembly factor SdhE n=1 Tax=Aliiroseovarius salicola TaxID=3009082 RepID=A0ABT4W174_9RHOB|nr:succinate dehydrogenase assembly factor 2 [Aliiroseovarius sp. KMU-50]MDA5094256.1 succinate dehydrogenase assembly factor 2 [Aliiroseovarius sp. KMU-50]
MLNALLSELPGGPEGETPENRVKRLAMRSMRRGIKEMDIILKKYAEAHLVKMSPEALDDYEALLGQNDQDLYQWVSGQVAAPEEFAPLIEEIAIFTGAR